MKPTPVTTPAMALPAFLATAIAPIPAAAVPTNANVRSRRSASNLALEADDEAQRERDGDAPRHLPLVRRATSVS